MPVYFNTELPEEPLKSYYDQSTGVANDTLNLKLFEDLAEDYPKLTKDWNASQIFKSELNEVGKCPVTKYKIESVKDYFSGREVFNYHSTIKINELDGTITVSDFTKQVYYWKIWLSA